MGGKTCYENAVCKLPNYRLALYLDAHKTCIHMNQRIFRSVPPVCHTVTNEGSSCVVSRSHIATCSGVPIPSEARFLPVQDILTCSGAQPGYCSMGFRLSENATRPNVTRLQRRGADKMATMRKWSKLLGY
jgi:hypothetical protein